MHRAGHAFSEVGEEALLKSRAAEQDSFETFVRRIDLSLEAARSAALDGEGQNQWKAHH